MALELNGVRSVLALARKGKEVVPLDLIQILGSKKTTKEAWDTLISCGPELNMFEKPNEGVEALGIRLAVIVNKLEVLGNLVSEHKALLKFLRRVSCTYKHMAMVIESLVDLKTLSIKELTGRLLVVEERGKLDDVRFSKFCEENNIKHNTTTSYTPQQNGIVERRNQIVVEMVHYLMKSMKIPDIYNPTNEVVNVKVFGLCILVVEELKSVDNELVNVYWKDAMEEEMKSIFENKTWELVSLPTSHRAIGLKWVFRVIKDPDDNIVKHNARLIAKGYA
ncbi:uncharacterized protein LOC124923156 [Impatiens glandulifera]|uniref:uncharacterized protein LOC124923156 n=1 Tax=Impatiens glandulifera TaxID=253017 RepID=UPI001FB07CAD|nr:uncharacterized protein LOC124923156 [Impatiens glandulifera]